MVSTVNLTMFLCPWRLVLLAELVQCASVMLNIDHFKAPQHIMLTGTQDWCVSNSTVSTYLLFYTRTSPPNLQTLHTLPNQPQETQRENHHLTNHDATKTPNPIHPKAPGTPRSPRSRLPLPPQLDHVAHLTSVYHAPGTTHS